MTSLEAVVGIDDYSVQQLKAAGVNTIEQLVEYGATPTGRMRLADCAHLDHGVILQWVHQADLMRIKGVGPDLAYVLCHIGVLTVPRLAYHSAEALHKVLVASGSIHPVADWLPRLDELRGFIETAKRLPKLVLH